MKTDNAMRFRKSHMIWILAAVLVSAGAYHPLKWKFFPVRGEFVNTDNWLSYCVGRFVISLPPTAIVEEQEAKLWGQPLVWRKDLTRENMHQEVAAEIEKLKNTRNIYSKNIMFRDRYELENGSIVIVRDYEKNSDVFHTLQCFLISNDRRNRIFTYNARYHPDKYELAKEHVRFLANVLRARDLWEPAPKDPGFCFKGGFLAYGNEQPWRGSEHTGLWANFPEYSGIDMALSLWTMGIAEEPSLTYSPMLLTKLAAGGIDIPRLGDVKLGNIEAREAVFIETNAHGKKEYDFELTAPSRLHNLDRPSISLNMNNSLHRDNPREPFASLEQALGLWDAISRSIRPRPVED